MDEILKIWAKKKVVEGGFLYHPLLFHMIDSANVCFFFWTKCLQEGMKNWFMEEMNFNNEKKCRASLAFWSGLHDIGKCSPDFQGCFFNVRHEKIGEKILKEEVFPYLKYDRAVANRLGNILGAHHGQFNAPGEIISKQRSGSNQWTKRRIHLATMLKDIIFEEEYSCSYHGDISKACAMVLAGLISVSDWIASNEKFFEYADANACLSAYCIDSKIRAENALDELKWKTWKLTPGVMKIEELFPFMQKTGKRPFQIQIQKLMNNGRIDSSCNGMVIIEAPTGEGKTEAAMLFADRWITKMGQQGSYFALPSRATSNQMFSRIRGFLNNRFGDSDNQLNLMLLHGHASLNAEFQALKEGIRPFDVNGIGEGADKNRSSVIASEWFTYRKRGLLAHFGVGTIDQLLLAALQTKHVFVRLFGLSGKTVIIDEAHAYDNYMTTLMERLIEWLAAVGCSVVILSATLPRSRLQRLARAFSGNGNLEVSSYPRITYVSEDSVFSESIETSDYSSKKIKIRWPEDVEPADSIPEWIPCLMEKLEGGGCAAIICNTVRRAQEVYKRLTSAAFNERPEKEAFVYLFHARFLNKDKEAIEGKILGMFGKNSNERPSKSILISTQVVEQSLDLDFDLMITEIAPCDLLLQRAGRLHRHDRLRPAKLENPELWIMEPGKNEEDLPIFNKGTLAVYPEHLILRTFLKMKGLDYLTVPGDVENLIEYVYSDDGDCPADLTPALRNRWRETFEKLKQELAEEERQARFKYLKPPGFSGSLYAMQEAGLEEDSPGLHKNHQALTRLAPMSLTIVFLNDDKYFNAETDQESIEFLLSRSVQISHRGVVEHFMNLDIPENWKKSAILSNCRPALLDSERCYDTGKYLLSVSQDLGVEILNKTGGL